MLELPAFISERELLDAVGEAVVVTGSDGTILFWNRFAESLFGWSAEEAYGRSAVDLTFPADSSEEANGIAQAIFATGAWSGDFTARRKDGSTFAAFVTISPIWEKEAELAGIVALCHDISDRMKIQQELRDTAERLQLALEAGNMGTWTWERGTRVVHWDTAMEALFGLEPGTFGRTLEASIDAVHPEDREAFRANVQAAYNAREPFVDEHRVVWPDGSVHWIERRGHVARDEDDNVVGLVGVAIDIDERKQRERIFAEYEADVQRMHRRLQTGLLPPFELDGTMHVDSLYHPGEARLLLGGDFYDAVSLDDGALALVVGDVSGHGPDAAALGARLRAAWRALTLRHGYPAEVVAVLDQLLRHETPEDEMFATLAFVIISPDRRHAEVTLAGHPAPLLLTPEHAASIDVAPHPPLGMVTSGCSSTRIELPESWSLLLYTDGIIEGRAVPDSAERYGIERLVEDATQVFHRERSDDGALEQLLLRAEKANGGPLRDDVALLLVTPPSP